MPPTPDEDPTLTADLPPAEDSTSIDWQRLFRLAFAPAEHERRVALLVDLPDPLDSESAGSSPRFDNPAWKDRRHLAAQWLEQMSQALVDFEVALFVYPNARTNNGDLPPMAWRIDVGGRAQIPDDSAPLEGLPGVAMDKIFASFPILLAPTEFSATAPLKMAARRHPFHAATLPRFSRAMMPALDLDFAEVDRRCRRLAEILEVATAARISMTAHDETFDLVLDLRHRSPHVSSGRLHEPGTAGNLPSGETYIAPFEGVPGDPSNSRGFLPVELEGPDGAREIVIYRVLENIAVGVRPGGALASREAERLAAEPAYGNMAELGLGVLADLGIRPIGEILLDEKLGLHIAFGRSDHFGGQVGPDAFSSPDAVVHIDRVYLPETQPGISVEKVDAELPDGQRIPILRDGSYAFDF